MSDKTKNMMKLVMTIERDTIVLYAIMLGLLAIIVGIVFKYNPLLFVSYMLLFTSFDIIGYRYLLNNENNLVNEIQTPAYRVLQNGFMYMFYTLLYLLAGWPVVLACAVFQWLGGQDLMYYLFIGESISNRLNWMMWTPYGIIKGLFGAKDITKWEFIIQAVVGIIAGNVIATQLFTQI